MGDALAPRVRQMAVLVGAWHEIRRNSETSRSRETREEARRFGQDLPRNLRRIQRHLADGYKFARARAATPAKAKGKGKRPLVIAPLEDRIVQRAILDVLQGAYELTDVQAILSTPTSIGGIRGRGVSCALEIIDREFNAGARWIAGSDISGFFTRIRPQAVVDFLARQTTDAEFVGLFERALTVELANASELDPEDLKLFPTGDDGVAQGCPLSAFAGNVVLREFDALMNEPGRQIVCVRYIDDFMILARSERSATAALASAGRRLAKLGMDIYDPSSRPDKAFAGRISEGHEFLGYQIVPGVFPPAVGAQDRLLSRVSSELKEGRIIIRRAASGEEFTTKEQAFAQSLTAVDNVVRGWAASFRNSNCPDTMARLDAEIDRRLRDFVGFYARMTSGGSSKTRRRALGVKLLRDRAAPATA